MKHTKISKEKRNEYIALCFVILFFFFGVGGIRLLVGQTSTRIDVKEGSIYATANGEFLTVQFWPDETHREFSDTATATVSVRHISTIPGDAISGIIALGQIIFIADETRNLSALFPETKRKYVFAQIRYIKSVQRLFYDRFPPSVIRQIKELCI